MDLGVRRISSRWRLHLYVAAATLGVLGHQKGRVLNGGVWVLRAVEGAGAGVVGHTFHQVSQGFAHVTSVNSVSTQLVEASALFPVCRQRAGVIHGGGPLPGLNVLQVHHQLVVLRLPVG